MILFSVITAALAALTGILAVGTGRHWQFKISDYFRGKRNAVLYLWVVASTIFSICHSGTLLEYGVVNQWVVKPGTETWFWLHSTMGFLLAFAHIFVAVTLSREVGVMDKYLWSLNHRAK